MSSAEDYNKNKNKDLLYSHLAEQEEKEKRLLDTPAAYFDKNLSGSGLTLGEYLDKVNILVGEIGDLKEDLEEKGYQIDLEEISKKDSLYSVNDGNQKKSSLGEQKQTKKEIIGTGKITRHTCGDIIDVYQTKDGHNSKVRREWCDISSCPLCYKKWISDRVDTLKDKVLAFDKLIDIFWNLPEAVRENDRFKGCPHCRGRTYYERQTKKPRYRCGHCKNEFEELEIIIPKKKMLYSHTIFSPDNDYARRIIEEKGIEGIEQIRKELHHVLKVSGATAYISVTHNFAVSKKFKRIYAEKYESGEIEKGTKIWDWLRSIWEIGVDDWKKNYTVSGEEITDIFTVFQLHFHVITSGKLMDSDEFHNRFPNWIYKKKQNEITGKNYFTADDQDFERVLFYELGHSSIYSQEIGDDRKSLNVYTVGGLLTQVKGVKEKIEEEEEIVRCDCGQCNGDVFHQVEGWKNEDIVEDELIKKNLELKENLLYRIVQKRYFSLRSLEDIGLSKEVYVTKRKTHEVVEENRAKLSFFSQYKKEKSDGFG